LPKDNNKELQQTSPIPSKGGEFFPSPLGRVREGSGYRKKRMWHDFESTKGASYISKNKNPE